MRMLIDLGTQAQRLVGKEHGWVLIIVFIFFFLLCFFLPKVFPDVISYFLISGDEKELLQEFFKLIIQGFTLLLAVLIPVTTFVIGRVSMFTPQARGNFVVFMALVAIAAFLALLLSIKGLLSPEIPLNDYKVGLIFSLSCYSVLVLIVLSVIYVFIYICSAYS